jgi:lipoprotein-releasing system permease protein
MFNPFERMIAFRYLRARKGERFVSVIAIFSLVGIALGVATLIIVMSVMNGFRQELLGRILGLNGHMSIASTQAGNLPDYGPLTERIRGVPGVVSATPLVEGQVRERTAFAACSHVVSARRAHQLKRSVRPELKALILLRDASSLSGG